MGLLEEARTAQQEKVRQLHPCAVAVVLTTLGKSDRDDLETALGDKSIDAVTLATVLRGRGLTIHQKQIQSHRRGDCPCAR